MASMARPTPNKGVVRDEEQTAAEGQVVSTVVKTELAADVASLKLSTPMRELRRSPRKRTMASLKEESGEEDVPQNLSTSKFWPSSSSRKRARATLDETANDPEVLPTLFAKKVKATRKSSPVKKVKREYAPPEAYAHLDYLNDYLKEHLDVMFCGINPGCKSSETGHHFAHATNHFWRALHLSGFTDRLLKPAEDSTLPELYNVGLTNLVERPSAEQAELSLADMQNGVPSLLAKIALYQPRVVCFVGKQIGEVFLKNATNGLSPPVPPEDSPSAETKKGTKTKRAKKPAFKIGFQPFKVVHPAGSAIAETLFFIIPSSSARVTGYQLEDKADILRTLYDEVQRLKAGNGMQTTDMQVIPLPLIEQEQT